MEWKQALLVSYPINASDEFVKRVVNDPNNPSVTSIIQDFTSKRNKTGFIRPVCLSNILSFHVVQVAVGPSHIAFLFSNGEVARVKMSSIKADKDPTSVNDDKSDPSGTNSNSNAANAQSAQSTLSAARTAKMKRMMLAARRQSDRGGVIVNPSRYIPASSIPEELIAQAQVVLQGKSREVIIRELQRTNLNVNEAVNNLLSRDDDEDMDESSDPYLPEELLTLLDAGLRGDSHGSILDETFYSSDLEYFTKDYLSRRKNDKDKKTEKSKENLPSEVTVEFEIDDSLQYWRLDEMKPPSERKKFIKIAALTSELIAVADDGCFYGWLWSEEGEGVNQQHRYCEQLLSKALGGEKFIDIVSCAHRVTVATNFNRIASFLDYGVWGSKITDILLIPLKEIPNNEKYLSMAVCSLYSVIRTSSNSFYWCGVYPFNERTKTWERLKFRENRNSHSEFEITQGCEVRLKSRPMYSAGSIAINLTSSIPLVGTLMESAWTLPEMCRFQVRSPMQFEDEDLISSYSSSCQTTFQSGSKRQRNEADDQQQMRETPWAISDVLFIHEEGIKENGTVTIVDGAYCGVVYKSKGRDEESNENDESVKIRLMRVDDLVVVSAYSPPCAPNSLQSNLVKLPMPNSRSFRKIHSFVVDENCITMLSEFRGSYFILKLNTAGKMISELELPILSSVFLLPTRCPPALENYGELSMLVMRDGNGSVIPLIRDAGDGYREPPYLALPPVHRFALGVRSITKDANNSDNTISQANERSGILFALLAPTQIAHKQFPYSLIQSVLYCNARSAEAILDALFHESEDVVKNELLLNRCDGNRTVLHVALMNSFSSTNKDDFDVGSISATFSKTYNPLINEMKEAEKVRSLYDDRWKSLISQNQDDSYGSRESVLMDCEPSIMPDQEAFFSQIMVSPVQEAKNRQKNAIEIVHMLCNHPTVVPYFQELLTIKDINGHTPFMCAINFRAYTAARIVWDKIYSLKHNEETSQGNHTKKQNNEEKFFELAVFPHGSRQDDSPLFVLCANDTCSFTWTGDEHINQDIFECITCGLVGTLCCCTECAFTCHRHHKCHLKRTSPTAYCDCWEKCSCKALITGNSTEREKLLEILVENTDLIHRINSRNEHILLFVARTVGRQIVEQENQRRPNKMKAQGTGSTPEHDLEPPRFARTAFVKLLTDWRCIKSLILHGCRDLNSDAVISEDMFFLKKQNCSSQLDKFVFTLFAKCSETHIDPLLNMLILQSNKKSDDTEKRDLDVDFVIGRFVRSVVRLYVLLSFLSPQSMACSSLNVCSSGSSPRRWQSNWQLEFVSLQSIARMARISSPREGKSLRDSRKKRHNEMNFVLKCRRIFHALISFSINELVNIADSLIAPVRLGILRPNSIISSNNNNTDYLEVLEQHLMSEMDLASHSWNNEEVVISRPYKRKRLISHQNERSSQNRIASSNLSTAASGSDASSDSDDDDAISTHSPRHHSDSYTREIEDNIDNASELGHDDLMSVSGGDESHYSESSDDADDNNQNDVNVEDDDSTETVELFRNEDEGRLYARDDGEYEVRDEDFERGEDRDEANAGDGNDEDEEEEERDDDGSESTFSEGNRETDGAFDSNRNETADPVQQVDLFSQRVRQPLFGRSNQEQQARLFDRDSVDSAARTRHSVLNGADAQNLRSSQSDNNLSSEQSVTDPTQSSSSILRRRARIPLFPSFRERSVHRRSRTEHENRDEGEADTEASVDVVQEPARRSDKNSIQPHALSDGEEDAHCSITKTSQQLSMAFLILIKILMELMPNLINYRLYAKNMFSRIPKVLDLNESSMLTLRETISSRLAGIWSWLETVLDRMEAQLCYISALDASSAAGLFTKFKKMKNRNSSNASFQRNGSGQSSGSSNRDSNKNGQHDVTPATHQNFLTYVQSIMRSHSWENGDSLPVIEYGMLKSLVYITEAYLTYVDMLEKIDSKFFSNYNKNIDFFYKGDPPSDGKKELESGSTPFPYFFRRSKSLLYPGITMQSESNAFENKHSECLALADRPHLLRPSAKKEELFGLPMKQRNTVEHEKCLREHGAENPAYQGLSEPLSFSKEKTILGPMDVQKQQGTTENSDANTQGRPNVIVYPKCSQKESSGTLKNLIGSSSKIPPPRGFAAINASHNPFVNDHIQRLLSRWKLSLSLITKELHEQLSVICGDDISCSVLLSEMAGFPIRQAYLRKKMEKFRNAQVKDIVIKVDRDKHELIAQTIHLLTEHYKKRQPPNHGSSSADSGRIVYGSSVSSQGDGFDLSYQPPLACQKVKVSFKNEPGEGLGVNRSFYATVAEAFLTMQTLPSEAKVAAAFGPPSDNILTSAARMRDRSTIYRERSLMLGNSLHLVRRRSRSRLSVTSRPFFPLHSGNSLNNSQQQSSEGTQANDQPPFAPSVSNEREEIGELLFPRVRARRPAYCNKITGMLLDLNLNILTVLLNREEQLNLMIDEAFDALVRAGFAIVSDNAAYVEQVSDLSVNKAASSPNLQVAGSRQVSFEDDAPLFYRPSKNGYYSPIAGKNSPHRLWAFRTVGRMIGICLLQMEMFPLYVCRHVLKYILGRPINWYDLAFFDGELFERLRSLVFDETFCFEDKSLNHLSLTFEINLPVEEGGSLVELKPGGGGIEVTHDNVIEYIYLFVEKRLLGDHLKCLEAIKQGVFDVIPPSFLANLTAEDLRLLLCGTIEISMPLMRSYTTFGDEGSGAGQDYLKKLEAWFWSVCNKFTPQEKQDLIFFWTGSKSLPSSEDGFQPMPSILVRPLDDKHFPTANTCISRLYLPRYSRKKIMKARLLVAIKTTVFGFI